MQKVPDKLLACRGFLMRLFYYFAAFVGFVALGPLEAVAAEKQLETSDQRIVEALENISANQKLVIQQENLSSERAPCLPNQDNRKSDLCAQWKAADAAAESAEWSRYAALIGAMSGLFVLIALYFTFQSNRIARQSAERQLRAYLMVDGLSATWEGSIKDGERFLVLRPHFKNAGPTPALSAKFVCGRATNSLPINLAQEAWDFGDSTTIVGPGVGVDSPEIRIPEAEAISILKGEATEFVYGVASYADVFGHERTTRFAWQISLLKSRDAELPDLPRWQCVGDYNSAT